MKPMRLKLSIAAIILTGAISVLCFRIVGPDERGIAVIFGKPQGHELAPGLHFLPPYPAGKLILLKSGEIKRVYVGKMRDWQGDEVRTQLPEEMEYLTGDKNILKIKSVVQYRIKNASDYFFNMRNVFEYIEYIAEAELTRLIAAMTVEEVLTTGKAEIQIKVQAAMQKHLDAMNTGVSILSVQFRDVAPPMEVEDAFKAVMTSKQEKEKAIHQASGYQNEARHAAGAEAGVLLQKSEAEKTAMINRAQGESEYFTALAAEHRAHPELVKRRIYLEKMEKLLAKVRILIAE